LWLLAIGLAIGSALGVYGLRKTSFESTSDGLFYTPNAHLGAALSLLFVARILYRMIEVTSIDPTMNRGVPDFARSPATLIIFGLLAGYFVTYAVGLLRWKNRVGAQTPQAIGSQ
jgi:hypothetical protein